MANFADERTAARLQAIYNAHTQATVKPSDLLGAWLLSRRPLVWRRLIHYDGDGRFRDLREVDGHQEALRQPARGRLPRHRVITHVRQGITRVCPATTLNEIPPDR